MVGGLRRRKNRAEGSQRAGERSTDYSRARDMGKLLVKSILAAGCLYALKEGSPPEYEFHRVASVIETFVEDAPATSTTNSDAGPITAPEAVAVRSDTTQTATATVFDKLKGEAKAAVEAHCQALKSDPSKLRAIQEKAWQTPTKPWLKDQQYSFDLMIHKNDFPGVPPGQYYKPKGHIGQIAAQIADDVRAYNTRNIVNHHKSPPPAVLDIGVNYGWATFTAASMGADVYSFEPMQSNVEFLRTSLCLSPPEIRQRVHLFPFGLSNQPQNCVIASQDNNIGDGQVYCGDQNAIPNNQVIRETVQLRRLDDILTETEIIKELNVQVVKMDTEGHEPFLVEGAHGFFRAARVPTIHSEFNHRETRKVGANARGMMHFFFKELGYEVRENRPHHWAKLGKDALEDKVALNMQNFNGLHDLIFNLPGTRLDLGSGGRANNNAGGATAPQRRQRRKE